MTTIQLEQTVLLWEPPGERLGPGGSEGEKVLPMGCGRGWRGARGLQSRCRDAYFPRELRLGPGAEEEEAPQVEARARPEDRPLLAALSFMWCFWASRALIFLTIKTCMCDSSRAWASVAHRV